MSASFWFMLLPLSAILELNYFDSDFDQPNFYLPERNGNKKSKSSTKSKIEWDRKQRKALIQKQIQVNWKQNSLYLYQMKQMVKKVSTIIYYHILHSHSHNSKPSKLANLFNEKKLLAKKEGKILRITYEFWFGCEQ